MESAGQAPHNGRLRLRLWGSVVSARLLATAVGGRRLKAGPPVENGFTIPQVVVP